MLSVVCLSLFFNNTRYEGHDKNFSSKMRANGVRGSPMDEDQLSEAKLAMDHLGLLQ